MTINHLGHFSQNQKGSEERGRKEEGDFKIRNTRKIRKIKYRIITKSLCSPREHVQQ